MNQFYRPWLTNGWVARGGCTESDRTAAAAAAGGQQDELAVLDPYVPEPGASEPRAVQPFSHLGAAQHI
jgi:hypothetical protein